MRGFKAGTPEEFSRHEPNGAGHSLHMPPVRGTGNPSDATRLRFQEQVITPNCGMPSRRSSFPEIADGQVIHELPVSATRVQGTCSSSGAGTSSA